MAGCFDCLCGLFGGAAAEKKKALVKAKGLVKAVVMEKSCGPILVRTAWHDAGTFDKNSGKAWPDAGGATGSIRTDHEINAPPNAGLKKAITAYLQPIKDQVPGISWADLIQLGGAVSIEVMGGPSIPMKYGRVDGEPKDLQPVPFGLPGAMPPFNQPGVRNPQDPAEHLRYVFYKYGMDDKDIVALSGAHTIGRAFKERSGAVSEGYMDGTAYTRKGAAELKNSLTCGGRSWTRNWLSFDNSYFVDMPKKDPECITFPTDAVLMTDPGFKPHFEEFAKDQAAFFKAYASAHKKLSECGSKFEPASGITGI